MTKTVLFDKFIHLSSTKQSRISTLPIMTGNTIAIARLFSSIAASLKAPTVGALFAGSDHAASSRLAYTDVGT